MLMDSLTELGLSDFSSLPAAGSYVGKTLKVKPDKDVLVPSGGKYPNWWPQDQKLFLVGSVVKNFISADDAKTLTVALRMSDTVSGGNLTGTVTTISTVAVTQTCKSFNNLPIFRIPFPLMHHRELNQYLQIFGDPSAALGASNGIIHFSILPWSPTQREFNQASGLFG